MKFSRKHLATPLCFTRRRHHPAPVVHGAGLRRVFLKVPRCVLQTHSPSRQQASPGRASVFISSWLRSVRLTGLSQYTVMGRALAIDTSVAKRIRIPSMIAIDLYLECRVIEMGLDVAYNDSAVVYFKPANSMQDLASQVIRAGQWPQSDKRQRVLAQDQPAARGGSHAGAEKCRHGSPWRHLGSHRLFAYAVPQVKPRERQFGEMAHRGQLKDYRLRAAKGQVLTN